MFQFFKKKQQGKTAVFRVTGMHCSSCSMNIDGELEDTEGVLEAHTAYAKGVSKVSFNPEVVSEKQLATVISKLGYTTELISE